MYKLFDLNTFADSKGKLTPIEFSTLNLFDVKRVYIVYENLTDRGGHAHLVEEEYFFMSAGSCTVKIHDGTEFKEFLLEVGKNAIYIGNMIWHEFTGFSSNAVLTALSSTNYNPNRVDYIEDFNTFLNYNV